MLFTAVFLFSTIVFNKLSYDNTRDNNSTFLIHTNVFIPSLYYRTDKRHAVLW